MSTLTPPTLVAACEAALREANGTTHWDRSAVHASDLSVCLPGHGCARQLWLRTHGAPEHPPTPGELLMWRHGRAIQEHITGWLRSHLEGWMVEGVEVEIDAEGTGSTDILLRKHVKLDENPWVYERWVVEVKTVRGHAFNHRLPKPSAVLQALAYMVAHKAAGATILVADREGQNGFLEFHHYAGEQVWQWAGKDGKNAFEGCEEEFPYWGFSDAMAIADLWAEAKHIPEEVDPNDGNCPWPILDPVFKIKENKGPDSLYVEEPWQCQYCRFRDISCPGALPPGKRDRRIIAKVKGGKVLSVEPAEQNLEAALRRMIEAGSLTGEKGDRDGNLDA